MSAGDPASRGDLLGLEQSLGTHPQLSQDHAVFPAPLMPGPSYVSVLGLPISWTLEERPVGLSGTFYLNRLCLSWSLCEEHRDLIFQKKKGNVMALFKEGEVGTSLVAHWLRICLPMQRTRVRALVWEDPTCRGATKLAQPSSSTTELVSHDY